MTSIFKCHRVQECVTNICSHELTYCPFSMRPSKEIHGFFAFAQWKKDQIRQYEAGKNCIYFNTEFNST